MPTWDQPYVSYRSPVCAANIVATSQPLAVQAGLDVMRRGGNAVDAAVACAITLTVVEPNNNGIGSDAFAMVWDGERLAGLNASGRAPLGWSLGRFAGLQQMPELGWDSVTVPGAVSAWVVLSQRYGEVDFAELFETAIHYAEDGFQVGPKTAFYWQNAAKTYASFEDFGKHFLPAPEAGDVVFRPELARTLRSIAASRGASFYTGELAQQIAAASASGGGALALEDMARHEATWVEPLAVGYRGVHLHEIPPNGQGLAAQIALGILNHFEPPRLDSADSLHLQLEAMKIAIRAAFDHFADPRYMKLAPEELLDPVMLKRAAATISVTEASAPPPVVLPVSRDTVYLTTADASGKMVSFIQSNYHGFGSGIVVPDTGIAMQNRGCGFSLDPDHPNCVAPGKRPFHTIIPGFVTEAGDARLSFGVMGGHMQHQGHMQMVQRIFDHQQNPQAASDAPRWHIRPDFSVALETGFSTAVAANLAGRGHAVEIESTERMFGGAQLIYRTGDGYIAGSDHRKEGMAAGF